MKKQQPAQPKILLLDIETKPLEGYFWSLFDEQGGLPMLTKDWSILSWSAKWYDIEGKKKYPVVYRDQRKSKDLMDDKKLMIELRELLNEADYVVGHNLARFDAKKINARLLAHELPPPSPYKQIDTLKIAKKHFALTSNKLEYLAKFLKCTVHKMKSRKFMGMDLWIGCINGVKAAWEEMERYNKTDVLVLEEVTRKLLPWDNTINLHVFTNEVFSCTCGSKEYHDNGHSYEKTGIYKRIKCKKCGRNYKLGTNLLSKSKGGAGSGSMPR